MQENGSIALPCVPHLPTNKVQGMHFNLHLCHWRLMHLTTRKSHPTSSSSLLSELNSPLLYSSLYMYCTICPNVGSNPTTKSMMPCPNVALIPKHSSLLPSHLQSHSRLVESIHNILKYPSYTVFHCTQNYLWILRAV